jgi:hypoxia up-regulated 1
LKYQSTFGKCIFIANNVQKKWTNQNHPQFFPMNIFLFYLVVQVYTTVIGIDYGTDWLKVSVIKPGGIIETVLNHESKRKTQTVLNIRDGVRTFGTQAVNLGSRFPSGTFSDLKKVLGRLVDDEVVREYQQTHPNIIRASDIGSTSIGRGTVVFDHQGSSYQVEELLAMILSYAQNQASTYINSKISGSVISIPPHFSYFQRQAMLDAAEIAGVRVYALIHDTTAVSIQFLTGRKNLFKKEKGKEEYFVFYDMGAGSTVATLVSVSTKSATSKTVNVKVVAHDGEDFGGKNIDATIQSHLAELYHSQTGTFK